MCEEEIELHEELEDAQAEKRAPTRISQNYIAGARKFLAPVLMDTMTKQSDDPEEEGQGICGTAGACLELVTRTVMPSKPHGPSARRCCIVSPLLQQERCMLHAVAGARRNRRRRDGVRAAAHQVAELAIPRGAQCSCAQSCTHGVGLSHAMSVAALAYAWVRPRFAVRRRRRTRSAKSSRARRRSGCRCWSSRCVRT